MLKNIERDYIAKDLFEYCELGKLRKYIFIKDLKPINNLKTIFREIRDYFAGNVTGITRDEKIAQNIMRLLFCKIYDEKFKSAQDLTDFSNRPEEDISVFHGRFKKLFNNVKSKYGNIFDEDEELEIGPKDLSFIVSKIEEYSIFNADRDVIADAFEELIGTSFRGGEGQFFTPRNVVQMMVEVLEPNSGERILDPACGSGGFLSYALKHLLNRNKRDFCIFGVDKDAFLSKIAKIYLSLIGNDNYQIFCENSLDVPKNWSKQAQNNIKMSSFDLILTNPPFGAKIPIMGSNLLNQYKLGHKWKIGDNKWHTTKQLLDKQPPQVLFIERCLQFLKENGRLGIVLPEGIFGNPSDKYIWECILDGASIIGVVSLSQETFQPSTHTKTSVLFLKKTSWKSKSVFMALANAVGHNKNGKVIYKMKKDGAFILDENGRKNIDDDLPIIADNFNKFLEAKPKEASHLGFSVDCKNLNDHIYIPEYYNPEIIKELNEIKGSGKYRLITMGELVGKKVLQIKRGNEIGSQFYGNGGVPFVRTSDIVNWEIKLDPIKAVSEEIYNRYKKIQDIREKDILFVNDGTFLIGRSAIVTKLDLKIIIQSHIRKIRVLDENSINPYYLFYLLNSKIVRKQIDAKTFVQATISTLGNRINEIILPICLNKRKVEEVSFNVKDIIEQKTKLREKSLQMLENSI